MEHNLIAGLKILLKENGEAKGSYTNINHKNEEEVLKVEIKDISEVIEGIPLGDTKQYSIDLEYKDIKGHKIYTDIEVFFSELEKDLRRFGL